MEAARFTRKWFPRNLEKWSLNQVIDGYQGNKRRIYVHAAVDLAKQGFQKRWANVQMFVKPDRIPEWQCEDKMPRAIQYRKPHYNLAAGQYIKPYEHECYMQLTMDVVSGTRIIAKGLNNEQRAELLVAKADHFSNPLYLAIDHSKFDSTINQHHLRSTHQLYQRAFASRNLHILMKQQLNNSGFTKGGIRYKVKGTRMSGDPDTGLGNSIVNAIALRGFLRHKGVERFDILLDGDDSVVIVERDEYVRGGETAIFKRLGFETKIEYTEYIQEVDFCQSRIVFTPSPVFVRNPLRVLSHACVAQKTYAWWQYRGWLAAVGECEMACNYGVPVLAEFGRQLAKYTGARVYDDDLRWRMQGRKPKFKEVNMQARISFYNAWQIPVQTQLYLEGLDFTAWAVPVPEPETTRKSKPKYDVTTTCSALRTLGLGYESMGQRSSSSWWSSS